MDTSMSEKLSRYVRQIPINQFGKSGQKKLRKANVLIAGAGGLGSAIAIYLTVAGIGRLGIIDNDAIELSNLNRQVLYSEKDLGRRKTEVIKEQLNIINHDVQIISIDKTITEEEAFHITKGYDLIIDALDNFSARYMLNNASLKNKIPMVHGAVKGFEGRVTTLIPGETPCLRCIYPKSKLPELTHVLGVTAAVIGNLQATETIKYIVGCGNLLTNRLLIYDGYHMDFMVVKMKKKLNCTECGDRSKICVS